MTDRTRCGLTAAAVILAAIASWAVLLGVGWLLIDVTVGWPR